MSLEAIRHLVYSDLLASLPVASADQVDLICGNLGLEDAGRLLMLRVTPDVCETNMFWWNEYGPGEFGKREVRAVHSGQANAVERLMMTKYGDKLADVPGFYRRGPGAPFRLNLPERCGLFGYGDIYRGPSRLAPAYYTGIMCVPMDRPKSFFLLSSKKFDGPKAVRMSGYDSAYFTQYQEEAVAA